jgi:hypothetical protein
VPTNSEIAGALIDRVVIDWRGRRLGRVIAVIHKAEGIDVLVEGRRWLLYRGYRFAADDLTWTADGRVVVSVRSMPGRRHEARVIGMDRVSGGKGR